MKDIIRKLTSRKFLTAVLIIAAGTASAFGVEGDVIKELAGMLAAAASAVAYIITEGKIDAASASKAGNKTVSEVIDQIESDTKEENNV